MHPILILKYDITIMHINRPPLIPSLTIGSVTLSTKGPTKSILSTREDQDQDNDAPYLQAVPRTEGNRLEGFGKFGSSFEGIIVNRESKFAGDSEEKGKLGDSELSVDEVEEEKTHAHESNGREVDKDKGKEKETDDPYYNSDFDNTGYDDDDDDHADKPAQATAISKPSVSGKNGHISVNNGAFTSWCMPSDNVARVRFVPDVVSDVFLIREKHSLIEIPNLFYTHDESIQFTSDYNRYVHHPLQFSTTFCINVYWSYHGLCDFIAYHISFFSLHKILSP